MSNYLRTQYYTVILIYIYIYLDEVIISHGNHYIITNKVINISSDKKDRMYRKFHHRRADLEPEERPEAT